MIEVARAVELVLAAAQRLAPETVPLQAANGRVLADAVTAERDQPPFDRVMMDGIAIRCDEELRQFRRTATLYAGEPPIALDGRDTCIEVMTGCVLPAGADTVVPVEQLDIEGETVRIDPSVAIERGQFIHRRGSDHPAGTELLAAGQRIGAPEMAVLASAGAERVAVVRAPSVTVVATGDELVAAGQPIAAHQIRLSNGPALLAAAANHGAGETELVHCPDSRERLKAVLAHALAARDVVVLSGGVSRGKADYVPEVLAELGVEQTFHRVAQRPGKPLWFGTTAGCAVFGLPGNPVSALVTFHRYVAPFLHALQGDRLRALSAVLTEPVARLARLTRFVPVRVGIVDARALATPLSINTSGDFAALAGTDGFVELAAGAEPVPAGAPVPLIPWSIEPR